MFHNCVRIERERAREDGRTRETQRENQYDIFFIAENVKSELWDNMLL